MLTLRQISNYSFHVCDYIYQINIAYNYVVGPIVVTRCKKIVGRGTVPIVSIVSGKRSINNSVCQFE